MLEIKKSSLILLGFVRILRIGESPVSNLIFQVLNPIDNDKLCEN